MIFLLDVFILLDAMENFGLVTYREDNLVSTEDLDPFEKQELAALVCHELAHQWFGNLVTMVTV